MLVLENIIEKISLIGDLAEQRLSNRQSYAQVQSEARKSRTRSQFN